MDRRTDMTKLIVSFRNFCERAYSGLFNDADSSCHYTAPNLERIWKEAITSAYFRKCRDICLAEENVGKVSVPGSELGS